MLLNLQFSLRTLRREVSISFDSLTLVKITLSQSSNSLGLFSAFS